MHQHDQFFSAPEKSSLGNKDGLVAVSVLALALTASPAYAGENIVQHTQSFEMTGHIAPTKKWTQRLNGLCGQKCKNGPRQMYTTSFQDTLLVSWMAADENVEWSQFGNVSTFKVSESGEFTKIEDISFSEKCAAVFGMTSNNDGSVIALLCEGYPEIAVLPDAIDLLHTVRTPDCVEEWEGKCYPIGHYSEIDSPLYIFEYTGGQVTNYPDAVIKINHAIARAPAIGLPDHS